ncbi:MAG: cytochrome b N-terminal domain-containing protein, partial [Planctomycetes bacterium]|nr:cytochrome b N-terminal domain-containing protein [Planctomycetota bacterium]
MATGSPATAATSPVAGRPASSGLRSEWLGARVRRNRYDHPCGRAWSVLLAGANRRLSPTTQLTRKRELRRHFSGSDPLLLHILQVFIWGAYKKPRELTWMVGVLLLVCTLGLAFTGYLLPWDQLAIWAITVGSNMARAHPFVGHE